MHLCGGCGDGSEGMLAAEEGVASDVDEIVLSEVGCVRCVLYSKI